MMKTMREVLWSLRLGSVISQSSNDDSGEASNDDGDQG